MQALRPRHDLPVLTEIPVLEIRQNAGGAVAVLGIESPDCPGCSGCLPPGASEDAHRTPTPFAVVPIDAHRAAEFAHALSDGATVLAVVTLAVVERPMLVQDA